MVSLRVFATILITLICQQIASDQPAIEWWNSVFATLGMSLGFGLLVKSFALSALNPSNDAANLHKRFERFQKSRKASEILWCLFLPAVMLGTGWANWLNAFQRDGLPHAIATLGCFLPAFIFILLVEVTAAQVDELHEEAETGQAKHWRSHLMLRLRLGDLAGLLTCITPVVLIAMFSDLSSYLSDGAAGIAVDPRLATAVAAISMALIFLLVFPSVFSRWSGAREINETILITKIHDLLSQTGIRGVQPMIVLSNGRWMGAAIVGWFPWFRKLWLGDALIGSLDQRELDMVILHELAHVERRHFLWRTLPVIATAACLLAIWSGLEYLAMYEALQVVIQMLVLCTGGFMVVITLGVVARYCELDADRRACELALQSCPWAQSDSPNAILASVLADKILCDSVASQATWLHPSLEDRLVNLNATARLPSIETSSVS
jgi:Zn-dependent protease with chaperone function